MIFYLYKCHTLIFYAVHDKLQKAVLIAAADKSNWRKADPFIASFFTKALRPKLHVPVVKFKKSIAIAKNDIYTGISASGVVIGFSDYGAIFLLDVLLLASKCALQKCLYIVAADTKRHKTDRT